jgi:hypothetical protein
MTRKFEIEESIKNLNRIIDISTEKKLSQEQITNLNLAAISSQLADISLTLAIIADKLESEVQNDRTN